MKKIESIILIVIILLIALFLIISNLHIFEDDIKADLPINFVLKISKIEDGLPKTKFTHQIVKYEGFQLSYNEENEQADWTAYILTKQMIKNSTAKRKDNFREDKNIITETANNNDYKKSGFDRGHLVPAADMKWSENAMDETFFMSNMSPQYPDFNRKTWKNLEEDIRNWASKNDSLYIFTGPYFGNSTTTIGKNEVKVPEYFFKAIYDISYPEYKSIAFFIKNENSAKDYKIFAITVDSLESLTGFDFLPKIEHVETIENNVDINKWN